MQVKILWADDEIELLKPHILFLEAKGYTVDAVNNGSEAVEKSESTTYDIIFLDENMPGISGLEALARIKEAKPYVPVVMITKSEEEHIMEEAIGSKIADYLIKPVNPNQILLSIKKNLDQGKLVSQKTNSNYQQEFRQLGNQLNSRMDADEWRELYAKLVFWELELEKIEDAGMREILEMQKKEANNLFARFIENNYLDWLNGTEEAPQMLHTLIKDKIAPSIGKEKLFVLVIDNLRFDQWKVLQPIFSKYFSQESEEMIFSILPTATHYARNAFFAGLMPSEIEKKFPNLWLNEEDEGGKNMHEKELLEANLKRLGKNVKWSYNKITNLDAGRKLLDNMNQLKENDVNFIVYNFVDMLSHARTEMEVIRELADDEAAYRSLTLSWFEHSALSEIVKKIADFGAKLIITTDHGTVKVTNPVKIVGERNTNTNLRYKVGRGLSYNKKEVFQVAHPEEAFLPKNKLSSEFVFAREADFFVYPNNYNHFVNYYGQTFQHGGISLEEMLIPFVVLKAK
ncbi:MAG: PglZ domain-containing protein [Crocinitomicaceae bacterium]|nr:PglZ domain-containing protein [Crocinitomicaceae bacterium]